MGYSLGLSHLQKRGYLVCRIGYLGKRRQTRASEVYEYLTGWDMICK